MAEYQNLSEIVRSRLPYLVVMFPGAPASGKEGMANAAELMRALGKDNVFYPVSITTPEAFVDKKLQNDRYREMADQVFAMLQERKKLQINTHSFGSNEALLFLRKIAEDQRFDGFEIQLNMLSPIAFGNDKLAAFVGMAKGTEAILAERDLFEANHNVFPLPPGVVREHLLKLPSHEQLEFSQEARDWRQEIFWKAVEKRLPAPKVEALKTALILLDRGLEEQPNNESLLESRAKLIAPYVDDVLNGTYLAPEDIEMLQGMYREKQSGLRDTLSLVKHLLFGRSGGRQLVRDLWVGHARVLNRLKGDLFFARHTSLDIQLVYLEDDKFVTQAQMERAVAEAKATKVMARNGTHFSPANDTKSYLQAITWRD